MYAGVANKQTRPSKEKVKHVSQKAIAEAAGVSQATVSLVLAGRQVSSDATRRKVLAAAERLRYRPNLLVHGMQTGKSRTVGVMAPPFDFYWSRVLYGIHDVLAANDHVPITIWTRHVGPNPNENSGYAIDELEQIHRLLDRRVDGVILWPPFASLFSEHLHEFSSRDLPVVTIDHELPAKFRADSVGSDESLGGRVVAQHLLSLGHKCIGHLAGPSVATWAAARRAAIEAALAEKPGVKLVTLEAPVGDTAQAIVQAQELLTLPDRPTAIYAASDLYAKVVYRAARALKLKIPEDVSIVGFSDEDFAGEMEPPLTTVRQHPYDIGRKAAEILLARSNGEVTGTAPIRTRMPVELVARESTTRAT
jgi:LacI family transcriptional regulator